MQYPDLLKHDLDQKELSLILHAVTGHLYTFAVSSDMRWGKDGRVESMGEDFPNGFYQLMPHKMDDGFFDWYCYRRDEQQFFASPQTATLHFIYYWTIWQGQGKPKAF